LTARNTSGGALSVDALRQLHRPADPVLLGAEARRLAATGLKPRDIAGALRWALPEVLEALAGDRNAVSRQRP